jgi:hypothetical protein
MADVGEFRRGAEECSVKGAIMGRILRYQHQWCKAKYPHIFQFVNPYIHHHLDFCAACIFAVSSRNLKRRGRIVTRSCVELARGN